MGQLERNPPQIQSKKVPKVPSCRSGSTHCQKVGFVVVFGSFLKWVDPPPRRSQYTRVTHYKTIAHNGFETTPLTHFEKVGLGSRFTHSEEVGRFLLDHCWTNAVPLLDERSRYISEFHQLLLYDCCTIAGRIRWFLPIIHRWVESVGV